MSRAWIASSERIAPWAAGLLLALPVLAFRYPPMSDLAMHEALVSIMRHLHDPAWAPEGLYYVVAPQANQLFPLAACALSFLLPTDVACKVLVAAIVLVTPPLMARLLRRLHLSPWLALLMGPITCGWMFRWGLVANLTGFVCLLAALPALERLARRPTVGRVVLSSASACVIFFAHESSAILFGVVAAYFALVRGYGARGFLARLVPTLVALGLTALQWRLSDRLLSANMRAIGTDFGADPMERLEILPGAIFGGLGATRLAALGGVWVTALALSIVLRDRSRDRTARPRYARRGLHLRGGRAPLRVALWRYRYALLAATFLILYFLSPMAVGGTTLIAHRFLPGACACLVLACASRATRPLAAAVAFAVPLVMLGVEMKGFLDADRRYRALDRMIALVPRGAAVAQLDLTPRRPGHVAPVQGSASRVQAERGGRMLFAMTDMPPNPVYVPPALQWNEPAGRLLQTPYALMPGYDLTRFAYLVVWNESSAMRPRVATALAPEAEPIASAGEWSLFRSRLPTVPLTTPDRPLPVPPPETLAERINRAQEAGASR